MTRPRYDSLLPDVAMGPRVPLGGADDEAVSTCRCNGRLRNFRFCTFAAVAGAAFLVITTWRGQPAAPPSGRAPGAEIALAGEQPLWCANSVRPREFWQPNAARPRVFVKILTYNLWWWNLFIQRHGNHGSAGKLIAESGKPRPYDIMGFQECEDPGRVLRDAGLEDQYEAFQGERSLCMAFHKGSWSLESRGHERVAEDQKGFFGERAVQWMRLRHHSGARVFFMNHHGPLPINTGGVCGGRSTAFNILRIIQDNAEPGDGIVLSGDFNANAASEEVQLLRQYLLHVYTGQFLAGIDNIFSNVDGLQVVSTKTLQGGGSDHNALNAIVEVGEPPPHGTHPTTTLTSTATTITFTTTTALVSTATMSTVATTVTFTTTTTLVSTTTTSTVKTTAVTAAQTTRTLAPTTTTVTSTTHSTSTMPTTTPVTTSTARAARIRNADGLDAVQVEEQPNTKRRPPTTTAASTTTEMQATTTTEAATTTTAAAAQASQGSWTWWWPWKGYHADTDTGDDHTATTTTTTAPKPPTPAPTTTTEAPTTTEQADCDTKCVPGQALSTSCRASILWYSKYRFKEGQGSCTKGHKLVRDQCSGCHGCTLAEACPAEVLGEGCAEGDKHCQVGSLVTQGKFDGSLKGTWRLSNVLAASWTKAAFAAAFVAGGLGVMGMLVMAILVRTRARSCQLQSTEMLYRRTPHAESLAEMESL